MTEDLLVSPRWLSDHRGEPSLRIVDASWYLPAQGRDARAEFAAGHIPGAVFFDIDAIADRETSLPHMLPDEESFAAAAGALGLAETDSIVVYDGVGLFSAPRVWWTLRAFGAADVRILDGGLPAWRRENLPLRVGDASPPPATFHARLNGRAVRSIGQVEAALADGSETIVDARSEPRFRGEAPEPRPGLRSGHMPGARNLPFDRLADREGRLVEPEAIERLFAEAGVEPGATVIASCGSGVTAAVLAFALARIGRSDVAIYDGAWAEWASLPESRIVDGPD